MPVISACSAPARPVTAPEITTPTGESVALFASPKGWLADESRWDLDRVVGLLDGAKTSIDLQVLTYSTQNRDKTFAALR